jgi:hypothetical protein
MFTKPATEVHLESYEFFPHIYPLFLLSYYLIMLYTPGCFKLVLTKIFYVFVISFIPVQGVPTEQVDSGDNATCDKMSNLNLIWVTNYSYAKHHYTIATCEISLTSPISVQEP